MKCTQFWVFTPRGYIQKARTKTRVPRYREYRLSPRERICASQRSIRSFLLTPLRCDSRIHAGYNEATYSQKCIYLWRRGLSISREKIPRISERKECRNTYPCDIRFLQKRNRRDAQYTDFHKCTLSRENHAGNATAEERSHSSHITIYHLPL